MSAASQFIDPAHHTALCIQQPSPFNPGFKTLPKPHLRQSEPNLKDTTYPDIHTQCRQQWAAPPIIQMDEQRQITNVTDSLYITGTPIHITRPNGNPYLHFSFIGIGLTTIYRPDITIDWTKSEDSNSTTWFAENAVDILSKHYEIAEENINELYAMQQQGATRQDLNQIMLAYPQHIP